MNICKRILFYHGFDIVQHIDLYMQENLDAIFVFVVFFYICNSIFKSSHTMFNTIRKPSEEVYWLLFLFLYTQPSVFV